jgi:excisionase family DNA binding protein
LDTIKGIKTIFTEYFTVADVMKILHISRTTAYCHIKAGRLKSYKIGRLLRIKAEDLNSFIGDIPIEPF